MTTYLECVYDQRSRWTSETCWFNQLYDHLTWVHLWQEVWGEPVKHAGLTNFMTTYLKCIYDKRSERNQWSVLIQPTLWPPTLSASMTRGLRRTSEACWFNHIYDHLPWVYPWPEVWGEPVKHAGLTNLMNTYLERIYDQRSEVNQWSVLVQPTVRCPHQVVEAAGADSLVEGF